MRIQPVAARNVAEALAELGAVLAARRGDPVTVEGVSDPTNPDPLLYESDQLLAGPDAIIAGPTFAEWLEGSCR